MYTELTCGHCDSYFTMDSEDEVALWSLVHRFAEAHVECGYMSPSSAVPDSEFKTKVIKARRADDGAES